MSYPPPPRLQELAALHSQVSTSSVNVEVDAKPQADMAAIMADIRAQYEAITEKNRRDMENWYKGKVMHRLTQPPTPPAGEYVLFRRDE